MKLPDLFGGITAGLFKITTGALFDVSEIIFKLGFLKVELKYPPVEKKHYDERIAQLDAARTAMADSIEAIDEIKKESETVKTEYEAIYADLQNILASKQDAEAKLTSVQQIISQDVNVFREVAGVPNIRRERWIAFIAGFLASTISAAFVALLIWGWKSLL